MHVWSMQYRSNEHMKKIIECGLLVTLIIAGVFSGWKVYQYLKDRNAARNINNAVQETIKVNDNNNADEAGSDPGFSASDWNSLKGQNPDFIGWLQFDSGLLAQPVVQGTDNDFYLKHGFEKQYSSYGTVFMDHINKKSDTNQIIYGHYVYFDDQAMFSQLTALIDQNSYDANKTFKIYYQDQTCSYQICYIYDFDSEDYGRYDYQQMNFNSQEEFDDWIQYPTEKNLIHLDDQIKYGDRFVTLQTCRPWHPEQRIILLCKQKEKEMN